jgi:hypothetical protein
MFLVNIVDMTSINKLFYVGSVFMQTENLEDFLFIFKFIKRQYDGRKLPYF